MSGGRDEQAARPVLGRSRRLPWVGLFFVAGLVLVIALPSTAAAPAANWPWLATSALLVGLAGYEIWRADHPGESARRQVMRRAGAAVATVSLLAVGSVVREQPVEAAIAAGSVVLAVLAAAVVIERSLR